MPQYTQYNFDEIIERNSTDCEKYDSRSIIFGRSDIIPLWVADTDFRTPDFIVSALKERMQHEIFGYTKKRERLFEAIQRWYLRRHSFTIRAEWIQFSPNVVSALASVVLSMTNTGDKIIVQPPVYFPFFHLVEGNGRVLVENKLRIENGRYTFDFEDLLSKIDDKTKMLLLCNPHNPGGTVWNLDELKQLSDICLEKGIIIISDEIHSDLILQNKKHVCAASISDEAALNTITVSSASKTFNIAGLSLAYLLIPDKKLRSKYEHFMQASHLSSGNIFGLIATEAAYTYGDEWLEQLLIYLENNAKRIDDIFAPYSSEIKVMRPEATFLSWVDVSGIGIDSKKATQIIAEHGVGISPGYLFGKGGENFIRINFGCPQSVLETALHKIIRALKG
jgi:cysteine-S-conjugate beta-lyase